MKIKLTSVVVEDQTRALAFYTAVLGFRKAKEIPVGEFRWLTVVSPEGHPDVELSLEPNANPASKAFQEAIFKQGIPIAAFEVDDIEAETKRLKQRGVKFTMDPTARGPVKIAIFADTCGNLIQIYQPPRAAAPQSKSRAERPELEEPSPRRARSSNTEVTEAIPDQNSNPLNRR